MNKRRKRNEAVTSARWTSAVWRLRGRGYHSTRMEWAYSRASDTIWWTLCAQLVLPTMFIWAGHIDAFIFVKVLEPSQTGFFCPVFPSGFSSSLLVFIFSIVFFSLVLYFLSFFLPSICSHFLCFHFFSALISLQILIYSFLEFTFIHWFPLVFFLFSLLPFYVSCYVSSSFLFLQHIFDLFWCTNYFFAVHLNSIWYKFFSFEIHSVHFSLKSMLWTRFPIHDQHFLIGAINFLLQ